MERMLPTHGFHVVFTLPRELRRLALVNPQIMYDLLFASAAESLLELGRDPKWLGADLGVTSVLLDGLRRAYDRGELRLVGPAQPLADRDRFRAVCDRLYGKRWVVYCKPPFGGPDQVYRYLGRYTHRVGLSNDRLLSLDERGVTFRTRGDGRVTLAPREFLRRFVLHVLPRGFVKIRHHGLFAAGNVATKLAAARRLLGSERGAAAIRSASTPRDFRQLLLALTGIDLRCCRRCGSTAVVRCPLAVVLAAAPSEADTP
jgi:Putative transposase